MVTVLVDASMTDTKLSTALVTSTVLVEGFTATAIGLFPTETVAVTVLVDALMTDSELPLALAT